MFFLKVVEKAISEIEKMFDQTSLNIFMNSEYEELYNYHFSLGLKIRNEILKDDNNLYNIFIKSGITQKDDMSNWIIKIFYIYIKSKSDLQHNSNDYSNSKKPWS